MSSDTRVSSDDLRALNNMAVIIAAADDPSSLCVGKDGVTLEQHNVFGRWWYGLSSDRTAVTGLVSLTLNNHLIAPHATPLQGRVAENANNLEELIKIAKEQLHPNIGDLTELSPYEVNCNRVALERIYTGDKDPRLVLKGTTLQKCSWITEYFYREETNKLMKLFLNSLYFTTPPGSAPKSKITAPASPMDNFKTTKKHLGVRIKALSYSETSSE